MSISCFDLLIVQHVHRSGLQSPHPPKYLIKDVLRWYRQLECLEDHVVQLLLRHGGRILVDVKLHSLTVLSSGNTTNILSMSKSLPIMVVTPAGTLIEDVADSGSSLRIFIQA